MTVSDMEYAQCMRHVLTAVDSSDLVALLEQTRLSSEELAVNADSEAAGQALHLRILYCMHTCTYNYVDGDAHYIHTMYMGLYNVFEMY